MRQHQVPRQLAFLLSTVTVVAHWGQAFSQQTRPYHGIVKDANNDQPVPSATINHKGPNNIYLADPSGRFSMYARPGDTLYFSSMGYQGRYHVLDEASLLVEVRLAKDTLQLPEVAIVGGPTPYQTDSLQGRETFRMELSRKPAAFRLRRNWTGPGISFDSPLSAPFQRLSPKHKRLRSFQRNFASDERQKYIETIYTEDWVGELTGLAGDTLRYFINSFPMDHTFARTATSLEKKAWVLHNLSLWNKDKDHYLRPYMERPPRSLPKGR